MVWRLHRVWPLHMCARARPGDRVWCGHCTRRQGVVWPLHVCACPGDRVWCGHCTCARLVWCGHCTCARPVWCGHCTCVHVQVTGSLQLHGCMCVQVTRCRVATACVTVVVQVAESVDVSHMYQHNAKCAVVDPVEGSSLNSRCGLIGGKEPNLV